MGGVASQEIIKVITQQYVPLNNAMIYNAVKSSTTAMEH
jgi:amyloid beta precursor protein binding protein 1